MISKALSRRLVGRNFRNPSRMNSSMTGGMWHNATNFFFQRPVMTTCLITGWTAYIATKYYYKYAGLYFNYDFITEGRRARGRSYEEWLASLTDEKMEEYFKKHGVKR
ncbi:uncharacterized protein LOC141858058 [Brevipalpus obovatus]|uniref:uncharacterized protein LOC141858058 n=1 Tax=Brevipalpus obovatus TaxID=246614 RepID=UPI003D9F39EF